MTTLDELLNSGDEPDPGRRHRRRRAASPTTVLLAGLGIAALSAGLGWYCIVIVG